jgi:hypothetical protein
VAGTTELPYEDRRCRVVPSAGDESPASSRCSPSLNNSNLRVIPDGLEPSLPGCRPGVVAAGPRDYFGSERVPEIGGSRWSPLSFVEREQAEAVGLEPTIRPRRTPVFETGPSSGRMTSVTIRNQLLQLRGLESNQRPPSSELGVTTSSNCPAVSSFLWRTTRSTKFGEKDSNLHRLLQRQEAYR